jgi:hypothetical protein
MLLETTKPVLCWVSNSSSCKDVVTLVKSRGVDGYFYSTEGVSYLKAQPMNDVDLELLGLRRI